MDLANLLIEAIKYLLPAGLVLLAMRLMQRQQQTQQAAEAAAEWRSKMSTDHLKLMFNAYERALLFLARLEPEYLLDRLPPGKLPANQYARMLDQSIREELEHNLAQQLYIMPGTWDHVLRAARAMRGLIMEITKNLPEGASGTDLHQHIWSAWTQQEQPITLPAIMMLKRDVQSLLLQQRATGAAAEQNG